MVAAPTFYFGISFRIAAASSFRLAPFVSQTTDLRCRAASRGLAWPGGKPCGKDCLLVKARLHATIPEDLSEDVIPCRPTSTVATGAGAGSPRG
jgi:hypothetical protein